MATQADQGTTAVPVGVCLTHGSFSGSCCPDCSTGGLTQAWRPAPPPSNSAAPNEKQR